jgi:hypothetical protein
VELSCGGALGTSRKGTFPIGTTWHTSGGRALDLRESCLEGAPMEVAYGPSYTHVEEEH